MLTRLQSFRQDIGYLPVVNHIDDYTALQKGIFYCDRYLRYLRRPQFLIQGKTFIFGIGLSKTGTSSLAEALNLLGYRCSHWNYPKVILQYRSGNLFVNCNKLLVEFDAYTDTPVARVYPLLDSAFPRARFILTVRDDESWFTSYARWIGPTGTGHDTRGLSRYLRQDLYGSAVPDRDQNIASFRAYNQAVQDYFKNRPQDLLVMNITTGDGWEKLCPFLGQPIPDIPFPQKNVSPEA